MDFDCVVDINYQPLFNGTTQETKTWLKNFRDETCHGVFASDTTGIETIDSYLARK